MIMPIRELSNTLRKRCSFSWDCRRLPRARAAAPTMSRPTAAAAPTATRPAISLPVTEANSTSSGTVADSRHGVPSIGNEV